MSLTHEEIVNNSSTSLSNGNLNYYNEENFEYFNHYDIENYPKIKWERPREIVDDPCLLESYDTEIDGYLTCGTQTPKWFPVLVTFLKIRRLLHLVIKDIKKQDNFNQTSYNGSFEFCFFGCNTWTKIRIDDRLPFMLDKNESLFCVSSNKEEFLAALLEKAYARYLGGYCQFQKIDFLDGLMNFTGGVVEQIGLQRHLTPLTLQDQKAFFKKIKSLSEDVLIIFDTHENKEIEAKERYSGVLLPHGYYYLNTGISSIPAQCNMNVIGTVLSAFSKNEESIDMVRLHNPVLNGDWNGAFSVGSLEWESISETVRRHYNIKFNHEFEFWMSMDDINRNMSHATICQMPVQSYVEGILKNKVAWHTLHYRGKFSFLVPGGPVGVLKNEFLKNDQYVIEVLYQKSVEMKLVLSVESSDKSVHFNYSCGVVLLKVENNRCFKLHEINNSEILNPKLLSESGGSYSIETTLLRGKYIILPWRNGLTELEYYCRVYFSNRSVNMSFIEDNRPPLVQCLKCNLKKKFRKTKDVIMNFSLHDASPEKSFTRQPCTSCLSINPESAIRMTVVSALNIECNDDMSLKSSYFVVTMSNYSYKSNTKFLTKNPFWNESFIFYRTRGQQENMKIEVYSEQKMSFDKLLGFHLFTEADLSREEIDVPLSMPINKEWVHTSSKIKVKFKIYTLSLFDTI